MLSRTPRSWCAPLTAFILSNLRSSTSPSRLGKCLKLQSRWVEQHSKRTALSARKSIESIENIVHAIANDSNGRARPGVLEGVGAEAFCPNQALATQKTALSA